MMESIARNLESIATAKADIKRALNERGISPAGGLLTYADAIRSIKSDDVQMNEMKKVEYEDLAAMSVGEYVDCVIANSSISTGYVIGHDGIAPLGLGSGFRSRSGVINSLSIAFNNRDYRFRITREASQSDDTITHNFTIENIEANFTAYNTVTSSGVTYQCYRYDMPASDSTIRHFKLSFTGRYPQNIYFAIYHANGKGNNPTVYAGDAIIHTGGSQSVQYTNINDYVKYSMDKDMEFGVSNPYSKQATFYVLVPKDIQEDIYGEVFSIKSLDHNKYIGGSGWSNSKTFVSFYVFMNANLMIRDTGGVVQPDDTESNDVIIMIDPDTQQAICSRSCNTFTLSDSVIDTALWSIYKQI